MNRMLSCGLAALVLAGCSARESAPPAPALESYATARQVMLGLTIPATDVIWGVANEMPADDAAWERVVANALMVAESGNLLLTGPRNPQQADWTQMVQEMIKHARAAAAAAEKHDVDGVAAAGDELYNACDSCHNKYMPAKAAELAGQQADAAQAPAQ
ncbi:MAG: hypothetical protein QM696_11620 [Steroidobacteraceae bacterium]